MVEKRPKSCKLFAVRQAQETAKIIWGIEMDVGVHSIKEWVMDMQCKY